MKTAIEIPEVPANWNNSEAAAWEQGFSNGITAYEDAIKAEHSALVAVAEAVERSLAEWRRGGQVDVAEIGSALVALSAVRAGQHAVPKQVEYLTTIFNTKSDADSWISEERRNAGFFVIKAAKVSGGFKVVFERRNGGVK
jgi:hypothetical protein